MGFIDNSNDPKLPVFYNVVRAVGTQCPNMRDDVMLVQYLLISFYNKALSRSDVYTRPKGDLRVDGVCGPITNNWIFKFQLDVNTRHPGTLAADKRVDRVRNPDLRGSITGTIYTLAVLNQFTKAVDPAAFARTPAFVPLQPAGSVPPPFDDVVLPTVYRASGAIIFV